MLVKCTMKMLVALRFICYLLVNYAKINIDEKVYGKLGDCMNKESYHIPYMHTPFLEVLISCRLQRTTEECLDQLLTQKAISIHLISAVNQIYQVQCIEAPPTSQIVSNSPQGILSPPYKFGRATMSLSSVQLVKHPIRKGSLQLPKERCNNISEVGQRQIPKEC